MPHVNVKMYPGRTEEQKQALTQRIIDAFVETIGVQSKHMTVLIEDIQPDDWRAVVVEPEIIGKKDRLYKQAEYL